MTGLDLARDALIEVAAVVTDSELTVLDDGTTLVRKSGVLLNGMIWLGVPPTAFLNAAAMGAGNGLPVTWLGATSGTSSGATP